jgi:hypothetical protein
MTTAGTQRSELAHRSTDGIEVSLVWSQPSDRITIELMTTASTSGSGSRSRTTRRSTLSATPTPTRPPRRSTWSRRGRRCGDETVRAKRRRRHVLDRH